MSEKKISVIMPVYGVEDYVGRAIESVQKQTFKNWEMFCVDDGSKDRSGEICDQYAEKDDRIKVIHKENGGAPSARNVAIEKANGEYLYFMDADDWAEPDMLDNMIRIAEDTGSELVVAGFYIDTYDGDKKFTQELSIPSITYNSQREFRNHAHELFDLNLLYTPWNKLYSADYIRKHNIRFPYVFWDDFPFNLMVIKDIEKVSVTDKKYYHFIREREESETARYRDDMYEKREEEDQWLRDLYKYWDTTSSEITEFLDRRYIERLIGCVENLTNPSCELSRFSKLKTIRQMIGSKRAREAVKNAKPRSIHMKLMLLPVKLKSTLLTYQECRFISYVKTEHGNTFAKLKAWR